MKGPKLFFILTLWFACSGAHALAQTYAFTTFAGAAVLGSADGVGSVARFNAPNAVAADANGNVYVADSLNCTVRKITPAGQVGTLAGSAGLTGTADGVGIAARFGGLYGIAVDSNGNVYVADESNNSIRKITADGVVTTLAGTSGPVHGGADGLGGAAQFYHPNGVAVDGVGNVYVADTSNNTIRKITPAGMVTTLAGMANQLGAHVDGTGSSARFNFPVGVATDSTGNVYVGDTSNSCIRKITPSGVVTTLAGPVAPGIGRGSADGTGSAAQFYFPQGVVVDGSGYVYVADGSNNMIRKIAPNGAVTTLAGIPGLYNYGSTDAVGAAARFFGPAGVAVNGNGTVWVADTGNNLIRMITPDAAVTTVAGMAVATLIADGLGEVDGTGTAARFNSPFAVAADANGNAYVADDVAGTIRKITPGGVVTTLAGTAGSRGDTDATGAAAKFGTLNGIAVDSAGNVFVADGSNFAVRKITPQGVVTTVPGIAASFIQPRDVAVDQSGNLYLANADNTIRKLSPNGVLTTVVNSLSLIGNPPRIAVDRNGNLYAAFSSNNTVGKIASTGAVTIIAGTPGVLGTADGIGSAAQFIAPFGIAVDNNGSIYVSDWGGDTIRKITPDGAVTTIAGSPRVADSTDGTGSLARFNGPKGVAVDGSGNLFVVDSANNTIRKGVPNSARLANLSILTSLTGGADSVTVGSTIGGANTTGTKPVLMRAAGPSLGIFGLSGLMDAPKLEYFSGSTKINENDGWGGAASVSAIFAQVGAFAFASPSSLDAALYIPAVAPGANSVRVSSADGSGGAVLVELYDASPIPAFAAATPRLINLSVIKDIGTGLTAGFVVGGTGYRTVLIRAVGPSLSSFGLTGLLANPTIELFDGASRSVASNDDWGGNAALSATFAQAGAFAIAGNSKDSALLATLAPGNYTVQVRSADTTSGTALVEVYEVP